MLIADLERANGASFIGDPALVPTAQPIVFLRRTHRFDRITGPLRPVYEFTAPFISKMVVKSNFTVEIAGSTTSRMAQEINGRSLSQIFLRLRNTYGTAASKGEGELLRAMLRRRGIQSPSEVRQYTNAMMVDPRGVMEWATARDLTELHYQSQNQSQKETFMPRARRRTLQN